MDAKQEAHIIVRVQAGETELFAALVQYYQASVSRMVTNMIGRGQAEDVAQEIFMTAFKNIGTYLY